MIQLGNHLFTTFELILFKRKEESKFYEWLLHHFMACSLILLSAYFNFLISGVLILQLHDIGDIFVANMRRYG